MQIKSTDVSLDSIPDVATAYTLPALLAARAARNGDAPLFSDRTTQWTGNDACTIAARRAGSLAEQGITRGDRVALLCSNRVEFMEVVLGCSWLGAVVVPINTASRGLQLEHILRNSGARLLVAESNLIGAVTALDAPGLALERIWLIGDVSPEIPLPSQWKPTQMPPLCAAVPPAALTMVTHWPFCTPRALPGCRRA